MTNVKGKEVATVNRINQRFIQATLGEYTNDPHGLLHVARLNYYRGFMLYADLNCAKNYGGKEAERDLKEFYGFVKEGIKMMERIQEERVKEKNKEKGIK